MGSVSPAMMMMMMMMAAVATIRSFLPLANVPVINSWRPFYLFFNCNWCLKVVLEYVFIIMMSFFKAYKHI